jgi:hypothetical protein
MVAFLSFVVCLAISAGFGYSAYQRSKRREMRAATRMAALALVPLGLDLAGFVRLGRKIGDAIGHWALHLVFDPLVWIGIVMLGLAALLWIATGFGSSDESAEPEAVSSAPRRAVGPSRQKTAPASATGEDPEIEAILRKHGVS